MDLCKAGFSLFYVIFPRVLKIDYLKNPVFTKINSTTKDLYYTWVLSLGMVADVEYTNRVQNETEEVEHIFAHWLP